MGICRLSGNLQVPYLDAIIVPISGGGMTSGIAVAAKGLKPDIKIIAAEPTGETSCLLCTLTSYPHLSS